MEAPLVPDTTLRDWTIVHDDGDIIVGSGSRVAFTSRKAFEAVEDGLLTHDREWGWSSPASSLRTKMLSFMPNSHVLVVDEAWGWKFSDECPQMRSAQDGRAVLGKLLQGRVTAAQKYLYHLVANDLRFFMDPTPEEQLVYLTHLREAWELYRQTDKWSPNNRSDDEGNLVFQPDEERCWVLTSREARPISWSRSLFCPTPIPCDTELMVLEGCNVYLGYTWRPETANRTAPAYLSLA